jgi:hypothetical protein
VLYVVGKAQACEIPGEPNPGVIRFAETDQATFPHTPLPPEDWADIKALNDFYQKHAATYVGQVRFFWKLCRNADTGSRITIGLTPIAVTITDPLLDIRFDVEALALSLPLPAVALSTLPEPDVFFGLKVNNPAWFAVTPG